MVDFVCKENYNLVDYIALISYLRSEKGCPWDRVQTHESLRRNLLEEAYETCEAIDENDPIHMREELGDLLLQIIFHSSIEQDAGNFDMNDIADAACKKLVFRHPHVFGNVSADTPDQVLDTWEQVKRDERAQKTTASAMDSVPRGLPALWRCEKIQSKAAKLGFDWPVVSGAMDKLHEETDELQQGIDNDDLPNIEEELGDVLFAAVNVMRFYKLDPETTLHKACEKFIRRFRYLEEGASKIGKELTELSLREMEAIYQQGRHDLEGKEPVPFNP
ncbi:MAG: nucleoside triphosphate pyrophosphohydrolase [Clostridia bacterium]|nr:nucleoside triphosphate pyrophosphohydrolase [Clostridia bacterium]